MPFVSLGAVPFAAVPFVLLLGRCSLSGECKDEVCTLPGYMAVDAATYAGWGIDSLKMDGCHSVWTHKVLDPAYRYLGASKCCQTPETYPHPHLANSGQTAKHQKAGAGSFPWFR